MALVLGHRFAHDLLHHHRRLDQVGLYRSTARAGYDIAAAPEFWRRFPVVKGNPGWSHWQRPEPAASLAATRDEIIAKEKAGQPLAPNATVR